MMTKEGGGESRPIWRGRGELSSVLREGLRGEEEEQRRDAAWD